MTRVFILRRENTGQRKPVFSHIFVASKKHSFPNSEKIKQVNVKKAMSNFIELSYCVSAKIIDQNITENVSIVVVYLD